MTSDEAVKTLAHLPPDELQSAIALMVPILDTSAEGLVANTIPGNVREIAPGVDMGKLDREIEALFVMARLEAQRHCH